MKESKEQYALAYILTGDKKYLSKLGRKKRKTGRVLCFTHSYKPHVLRASQDVNRKKRNRHVYPIPKDKTEAVFKEGNHRSHKPANLGFGEAQIYKGSRVMKPQTKIKQTTFGHIDGSHTHGNPSKVPYKPHGHICEVK